jgi:AcrR family transcriptional regulator
MTKSENHVPAPRRRLSSQERRESILGAAAQAFTARGYRGTKMSEVATMLGLSEPVIFQNFGSKSALYAAVLERAADQVRAQMQTVVEHQRSAVDVLAHVLDPSHGHGHGHGPGSVGVLFSDAATLIGDPELGAPAGRAVRAVIRHLADLVRFAQAAGELRAELDPQAVAWVLLSVLSTRAMRSAVSSDRGRLERRVGTLVLEAIGGSVPERRSSRIAAGTRRR